MSMKISHKSLGVCLRIFCFFGAILGIIALLYHAIFARNIFASILDACYLPIIAAILFILFVRKRPPKRFSYGVFLAFCCLDVVILLGSIYNIITMVSRMTNELNEHVVHDKSISPGLHATVEFHKCCAIDSERNTEAYFSNFRQKFPKTCSDVQQSDAELCVKAFQARRNLLSIMTIIVWIFRIALLLLLWKYIRDEYRDDQLNLSGVASTRSTTSSMATTK